MLESFVDIFLLESYTESDVNVLVREPVIETSDTTLVTAKSMYNPTKDKGCQVLCILLNEMALYLHKHMFIV